MNAPSAIPLHPLPLRIGSRAEFEALRSALTSAGYTEKAVCERLGFTRLSEYPLEGPLHLKGEPEDVTGLLIRLLIEGAAISAAGAAKLPLREMRALELIVPCAGDPARISAVAMLYPVRNLLIASDRTRPKEGETGPAPEDFVYPAIVANTEQYLELLQFSPCEAFLDLCAGTGIAALIAAGSGARHAWAYDITVRSTHFAEFNRRLNGIENVTAAQGDLYEPAGDLTFDKIVAHPPYVPVFRNKMVFDSGGQDGEQVVRRVIEGLPRYLRPGARFYAPTVGTDREQPFELRLRDWLGPAHHEFDVALIVDRTLSPATYVAEAVTRNRAGVADADPWRELFSNLGVRAIVRGFMILQRRERDRPVFTVRRQAGPRTGPAEIHRLVDWETAAASNSEELLERKPRACNGARLHVEHRLTEGSWEPEHYRLTIDYPFEVEFPAQAWTAHLIAHADGVRTTAELLDFLKSEGALHPGTPPLEFAQVVAQLVSGGFLEMEPA